MCRDLARYSGIYIGGGEVVSLGGDGDMFLVEWLHKERERRFGEHR